MADFINRRDLDFMLYELFDAESLCKSERFGAHDKDTFDTMLTTAHRIATEKFEPHAAKLDQEDPELVDGKIELIPEVKEAVDAFVQAGFVAMSFDEEVGGLQLPYTIAQAVMATFYAANTASAAYPLLTMAAANLLAAHANEEQRTRYLEPMIEGRFFGTMCLSEPGAGSSLSDILTTATPAGDGSYRLKGNKMWISAADHELSDNIVHLVLARLPGAPDGVKGISLFIVPKFRLDEDGNPGERNDVYVTGLNHKMGYRGTVNCVLTLGDADDCVGYLVGEEHHGLKYMFHMMNEARIGVGLGASMLGYAGYRFSLEYAQDRTQGRLPWNKDPSSPPVAIIEHADVKRMLLMQKCYVEGGLSLGLYCARLVDEELVAKELGDEDAAERANLLLELLTPIAKAWPSEYCLEANKLAIQVLGGYGYSREYPVERLYRDNRLNAIHEGTNGIQALDLLGRKVPMKRGKAFQLLMTEIQRTITKAKAYESLEDSALALEGAIARAASTTMTLGGAAMEGELPRYLANASIYLEMLGHIVIGWLWLKQATTARAKLVSQTGLGEAEEHFLEGKVHACRFFMRYELPKTTWRAELLEKLDDTTLTVQTEWL